MTGFEQMYWITRLDGLHTALTWFMGIGIVCMLVYLIVLAVIAVEEDDETINNWKKTWRPYRWFLIPFTALIILLKVFIPDKNDALLIMGAGTVLEYVEQSKDLQALPDKAVEALTEWSDNFLEEQRRKSSQH